MGRRAQVWTVVYFEVDDKDEVMDVFRLTHDVCRDRSALEAKIIALNAKNQCFLVVAGEVLEVTVDTSPRITIGGVAAPRRQRTTKTVKKPKSEVAS